MDLTTKYPNTISVQNYFLSPKMPIKDHSVALKKVPNIRQPLNNTTNNLNVSEHQKLLISMNQMKLLKPKQLQVVNHNCGKDVTVDIQSHSRQTNPGYSRNKLGGFYTS